MFTLPFSVFIELVYGYKPLDLTSNGFFYPVPEIVFNEMRLESLVHRFPKELGVENKQPSKATL